MRALGEEKLPVLRGHPEGQIVGDLLLVCRQPGRRPQEFVPNLDGSHMT